MDVGSPSFGCHFLGEQVEATLGGGIVRFPPGSAVVMITISAQRESPNQRGQWAAHQGHG
jgi:hypothetical protein